MNAVYLAVFGNPPLNALNFCPKDSGKPMALKNLEELTLLLNGDMEIYEPHLILNCITL